MLQYFGFNVMIFSQFFVVLGLSLGDVQSLGKEVWMRLAEHDEFHAAMMKAVANSSAFPENCQVNYLVLIGSLIDQSID